MLNTVFLWTDQMCIEGNKAWFVSARGNMLLEMDMQKGKVSLICKFPDLEDFDAVQYHTKCIKYKEFILCAPVQSSYFWLYNLKSKQFEKIESGAASPVGAENLIYYNGKVFLVAKMLGEIWEIDAESHHLCNRYLLMDDGEKRIWDSVIVKNKIFCLYDPLNSALAKIYEFDMDTKKVMAYELPMIEEILYAFCYDGNSFWLSGSKKNLYIWKIGEEEMQVLDFASIPIGCYDFERVRTKIIDFDLSQNNELVFIKMIATEKYIWCFPFRTNQILYFDRRAKIFRCFPVEGEEETRESLSGREIFIKYIVEYVREDRYIGLYSTKQRRLIEIDADNLRYEMKDSYLDREVLDAIGEYLDAIGEKYLTQRGIIFEKIGSLDFFIHALRRNKNSGFPSNVLSEIGKRICQSTIK